MSYDDIHYPEGISRFNPPWEDDSDQELIEDDEVETSEGNEEDEEDYDE